MIRCLHRRLGGVGRDSGTTLVELLCAIIVVSILGIAITATVTSMARQSTKSDLRLTATQQAQTSIDHIGRELRAAYPQQTTPASAFSYASATHLTFTSSLGNAAGPSQVDLNITGGNLQESITQTGSLTPTVKNLATGVTGSTNLFAYYDNNGNLLSTPMTTPTATSAIDHIVVTLVVQEANIGGPVTVATTVYPRDIEYAAS